MECNSRNRNIRYSVFRDLNLKKLSEYLVLQSNIFLYFFDRFSKKNVFFPFWIVIFYIYNVALFSEWLYSVFVLCR